MKKIMSTPPRSPVLDPRKSTPITPPPGSLSPLNRIKHLFSASQEDLAKKDLNRLGDLVTYISNLKDTNRNEIVANFSPGVYAIPNQTPISDQIISGKLTFDKGSPVDFGKALYTLVERYFSRFFDPASAQILETFRPSEEPYLLPSLMEWTRHKEAPPILPKLFELLSVSGNHRKCLADFFVNMFPPSKDTKSIEGAVLANLNTWLGNYSSSNPYEKVPTFSDEGVLLRLLKTGPNSHPNLEKWSPQDIHDKFFSNSQFQTDAFIGYLGSADRLSLILTLFKPLQTINYTKLNNFLTQNGFSSSQEGTPSSPVSIIKLVSELGLPMENAQHLLTHILELMVHACWDTSKTTQDPRTNHHTMFGIDETKLDHYVALLLPQAYNNYRPSFKTMLTFMIQKELSKSCGTTTN